MDRSLLLRELALQNRQDLKNRMGDTPESESHAMPDMRQLSPHTDPALVNRSLHAATAIPGVSYDDAAGVAANMDLNIQGKDPNPQNDDKGDTKLPSLKYPEKQPHEMQYGPNTKLQDSLSTASGPAPSHLGGGYEGASTKDILEGKVPLTMDSLGMTDYDLPEFETGADGTLGTGWRNADLSPLPGEETLHEDIRKWADTDRSAGGDGLERLRRAYMAEVEAGQEGRDSIGFEEWLESKGFDPYNEMGYRGNRGILNKIAPMYTTEDEDPDQAHRAGLRKEKVISSYLQRYGAESVLGGGGLSREEAELVYDDAALSAAQNDENPVIAAGRALKGATNGMQSSKDAQLRMNVDNRTSQNNRAQRFGVPVGVIATLDQFGDASTPEEAQEALMMGAMQYPYLGATMQGDGVQGPGVFQSLYNQMLAGEISIAQAQAEIAKATGKRPGETDADNPWSKSSEMMNGLGFSPDGYSTLKTAANWQGMPEEERLSMAAAKFAEPLSYLRTSVKEGQPLSPTHKAMIREMLGENPTIEKFDMLFGGLDGDEEYNTLMAEIYGESTRSWEEWGQDTGKSLGGIGGNISSIASGLWNGITGG